MGVYIMSFVLFTTLLACSGDSVSQQEATQAESTQTKSTQVDGKTLTQDVKNEVPAETETQSATVKQLPPKPKAKIGGTPILATPIVLGGISKDHIKDVMDKQNEAIQGCHAESKTTKGKVLIKFSIQKDGMVSSVQTESTSLRDSETEACLNELIKTLQFDPLQKGSKAIVRYPLIIE